MPQLNVSDFGDYAAGRADFTPGRKARLLAAIQDACAGSAAAMVLHVGRDPPDVKQLGYLPAAATASGRLRVVRHEVAGHALGAGLKAQGRLRRTVLGDLLGHTYRLPPAR